jgi:Folate-dependent phosphoribosylglycinamide formyltransferase PurN
MYGRYIHEAVIKNNEKYSGVTIHEVNEHFDEGKIIFQEKFALDENEDIDSLEQKIKELEALAIVEGFKICLK